MTMKRRQSTIGLGTPTALMIFIGASGCGSGAGSGSEGTGSSSEAIGEADCGYIFPDYNCGSVEPVTGCTALSMTANYNHSHCAHSYIMEGTTVKYAFQSGIATASYDSTNGPLADGKVFPCNAMWVRMVLYQAQGGSWTEISDRTAYGDYEGVCVPPQIDVDVQPGTYKIVAQAGFIYTYEPVLVQLFD